MTMWMQALMLSPYIALASSFVLPVTVAVVCYRERGVHAAGYTA
jgi:hypothetical protein